MSTSDKSTDSTVLFVTGTGRSGTSTVAGSLSRLGFVVPQPEVPADETNPRGFYEPRWVVDFHKRIFNEIKIRTNDARPAAVDLAREASASPERLAELTAWLEPYARHPRVVIKDPRTFWVQDLWRRAASEAGMGVAFLTMLRPPAEVAKSRDQHYLSQQDGNFRRARETTNVASWCHGILVTERVTRDVRRAFVSYGDLMADWRAALGRADESLASGLLQSVDDGHHPIDDFIDPRLNRSRVTWDELSVQPEISALADDVWDAVTRLVADPYDQSATDALDDLHERYDHLLALAGDLTLDEFSVERERLREQRNALKARHQEHLGRVRKRNERLEQRVAGLEEDLAAANRSLTNRVIRRLRRR